MVSHEELGLLQRFDADGRLALSLYLDVSSPERRATVLHRVRDKLRAATSGAQNGGDDPLAPLSEDLEMLRLYFQTSAGRQARYVAVFTCASQLFWRVYSLDEPLNELVHVGRHFELAPLVRALREKETAGELDLEPDLLLQR
ncbi:MAG: hypothetical protein HPY83_08900 [Anaerolineae bacterium]|nr:hypothetical protein [Anaerolineae bacterium]